MNMFTEAHYQTMNVFCHPCESRDPVSNRHWIPAFAGMTKKLLLIFLFLSISSLSFAATQTNLDVYAFSTTTDTARFNTLLTQFRCLVCQNENLADSNASIAADLRQQIYKRVLQGQSDEAIQKYLVARYGDYVLFEPPFKMNTTALWILPFLLLVGGVLSLGIMVQRRRKQT